MNIHRSICALVILGLSSSVVSADSESTLPLQGTWTLAAAYEIQANGTRTTNYGEHPQGLLMVDAAGRYSLQIFRPDRRKFASGVKSKGSLDEYCDAVVGSSTHTGRVRVDPVKHQLIFDIETASYPNWESTQQIRDYKFENDTLTYSVPASASGNGTIAYSVWKRAQ
jgi:Lipocalin-like domain